ncbi:DNA polymerase III subunit alpha [Mesorhizobium sp. M8A.F.Ca.ET.208.01.1.1]|uniref:error-prone DNA polymerase n=1 Tax=unclassified Mesorhizobium TaxID=325217 RepID=UPI001093E422|nr:MULTISPECIES: error-prone DNA polymerase [unclassified Mesorhizobium]TGQ89014.1 DNA polymerase III subunit alpha [Mesorhizobium sp. M8A.F.Ca.ET.208.01.1.1]TGR32118.1 DNA polymerase III subunit alpha [Mesorhizobium sp. M8A.F.Ca.ET.202.01.1.1]TGT50333.1 DNA polymerase III subunit alpha [Mesorhizobium sp. M8A.F.Ca.ET.167.01.1.1]TGU39995.1 DNA polymerase III subunit alpha [bacterium M00.F.Ca.ET.156.01.1.1]
MSEVRYAELQVTSHFSFLRGASSAEELFSQAALLGIEALAVADRNSLAGIVRAHEAARTTGVRLIVGCRLDLDDGTSLLVYPTDRDAYSRLCRLLSLGKGRAGKAKCRLAWSDVVAYGAGLIAVLLPDLADETLALRLRHLREAFGDRAYMALTLRRRPNDQLRIHDLAALALKMKVAWVVTNDVLFHEPGRRTMQDVVTAIRHNVTIDALGDRRERHADRHLKPPQEMHRLFARYPEALARTIEIANRCRFSLDELAYQYPEERDDPSLTPQQALEKLTWQGADSRYPEGLPDSVIASLRHELRLIEKLDYAPYFLTVNAIVRFARSKDILCQGRGSAANSAVCYVLGITSIDPGRNDLLFERFVSEERREPPDIDVDFEHERREIVMQWVFDTYGRDHAALCSTVVRYRTKGALRDVGKALGLPEDLIRTLSGQVWGWSEEGVEERHVEDLNLNLADRRLRLTLDLARQLMGAPRHLSQHPGGFVLTHDRLDDLVPIEPASMKDRQVIEWDKDDIDALKFMKVDVLALGMLTCMKKGLDLLADCKDIRLDLATIPAEDPRTYAMIRKADTLGTFQIESRAQMSMLPRLKPRTFYDLVVQVAIVRPGPIQGDMVHPYLRRREGLEPVHYPKPELEKVLGKTLGVPLFQEQAMRVAIECAGFTPGEADMLRKSMATFKFTGGVSSFKTKLIEGMVDNGYERGFAEQTFRQLEGFGSYGFPESHAASFALIAYASAWLKCWHPDVFCAALLNSQPMGFYAPAQIVRDAAAHGIDIRPACVNASRWECTLEPVSDDAGFAVRLGLRMVRGLANTHASKIVTTRADQPFASVDDLWRRAGVPQAALVQLAEADAFRPALGLARREALWAIKALRDEPLPLFAAASAKEAKIVPEINEPAVALRPMTAGGEVVEDYRHIGLTLRSHPISFLPNDLRRRSIVSCAEAMEARDGRWLEAAGIVLVRQRPGSAKGVMFITIEDETGIANLVVWAKVFEQHRRTVLSAGMVAVRGRIQREGGVVHLVARKISDLSTELASVGEREGSFPVPYARGDQIPNGGSGPDPRELPPKGLRSRDIYIPDLHIDNIKVKTRDFR